MVTMGSL